MCVFTHTLIKYTLNFFYICWRRKKNYDPYICCNLPDVWLINDQRMRTNCTINVWIASRIPLTEFKDFWFKLNFSETTHYLFLSFVANSTTAQNARLLNYRQEENSKGRYSTSGTPCRRWVGGKTLFFVRISLPLIELAQRVFPDSVKWREIASVVDRAVHSRISQATTLWRRRRRRRRQCTRNKLASILSSIPW